MLPPLTKLGVLSTSRSLNSDSFSETLLCETLGEGAGAGEGASKQVLFFENFSDFVFNSFLQEEQCCFKQPDDLLSELNFRLS